MFFTAQPPEQYFQTVIFHIVQSFTERNLFPSEFCICYEMGCVVEVCDQDIH